MDDKSLIQGRAAEAPGKSSETEQKDGWSNKGEKLLWQGKINLLSCNL